ncbi:hypothetical protein [Paraburkholderia humisilvae]|uniref:Uncharacterized protein n=1 Tax=Paraburkholderia humisilvae TaxID=627669 RepID=A0A6J5EG26_9BURK|nr:hypothetical protein [Paraburkholderia humisilvae]CAB3764321.1 hypothetical protein LMG29542_04854 [Paraburkholderia humisilvae]
MTIKTSELNSSSYHSTIEATSTETAKKATQPLSQARASSALNGLKPRKADSESGTDRGYLSPKQAALVNSAGNRASFSTKEIDRADDEALAMAIEESKKTAMAGPMTDFQARIAAAKEHRFNVKSTAIGEANDEAMAAAIKLSEASSTPISPSTQRANHVKHPTVQSTPRPTVADLFKASNAPMQTIRNRLFSMFRNASLFKAFNERPQAMSKPTTPGEKTRTDIVGQRERTTNVPGQKA